MIVFLLELEEKSKKRQNNFWRDHNLQTIFKQIPLPDDTGRDEEWRILNKKHLVFELFGQESTI